MSLLAYTEDDDVLRAACRQVLDSVLPIAATRRVLPVEHVDAAAWSAVAGLGWAGVAVAEELGGAGMGFGALSVLAEELGRVVAPLPLLHHALAASVLSASAGGGHIDLVGRLAAGDLIATVSLDVDGSCGTLHARRSGPGELSIDGWRALVAHGADASTMVVDVVLDGAPALVAVDLSSVDHELRPMTTLDLARPRAVVELAAARVPETAIVTTSADDLAWTTAAALAVQCSESVGAARWLVEATVEHARQRRQFDQPIGSFQAVKHRLADMRIELEASIAATRYAVWAVAERRADAGRAATVAAHWVGRSTSWIAGEALQLHGGVGFTWEHDLHLFMRRLKVNELVLGSPDFHARALGRQALALR